MVKRELGLGRCVLVGVAVGTVMLSGTAAWAAEEDAEASASASISGLPSATATGDTDHDRFVGSFGVGSLGFRRIPIAVNPVVTESGGVIQMDADSAVVDAPVVGVRYWFDQSMGVDFGLGIRRTSGTATWTMHERQADPNAQPNEFTFEQDDVSQTGILIHAGLPIALNTGEHYVFELVPEANIGFSTGTVTFQQPVPPSVDTPPVNRDDIKISGFRLDIGARVGSEVHFGFIGIPNLALQASVGLFYSMQKIKADGGARPPTDPSAPADAQPKTTYEESSSDISTTVHDSPWGIFQNTVSALYYF
ncbi:MAG: hypothetical protein ACOC1F_03310 [Myxococcota bacterium]